MRKTLLICGAIGLVSLLFAGYGLVNARINNPPPATAETDPIWTAASTTYLTTSSAASTYLTTSSAASTYLTNASATATYLVTSTAASTYLTQAASSAFAFLANSNTFAGATNTFATVSATQACLAGNCYAGWPWKWSANIQSATLTDAYLGIGGCVDRAVTINKVLAVIASSTAYASTGITFNFVTGTQMLNNTSSLMLASSINIATSVPSFTTVSASLAANTCFWYVPSAASSTQIQNLIITLYGTN